MEVSITAHGTVQLTGDISETYGSGSQRADLGLCSGLY